MMYFPHVHPRVSLQRKHIDIIKLVRVYKFQPAVDPLEVPNFRHLLHTS
jgi:hypothetical protein